jgi:hypothetical protein
MNLPYYYSLNWLEYLKHYNLFYQSELRNFEKYETNDFYWLITFYYSNTRNQLEFRTGEPYIMSPYWKHNEKLIKKRDLEDWLNKLNQLGLEYQLQNQIIIHQFPLESYYQQIPILEMLDYNNISYKLEKTIIRYRSWVELDKYTLTEIKSNLRKSYKSILNKFIKEHSEQVIIYDSSTIKNYNHEHLAKRFHNSHFLQAQKETKSHDGWLSLIKMIDSNQAILIEYNDNFLYFLIHPDYSYYGISASEKDNGIQIGLVFKTIEYLKNKNYKLLDMGMTYLNHNYQPFFSNEKDNPKKAFDIGFFKSGFATRITNDYYYCLTKGVPVGVPV